MDAGKPTRIETLLPLLVTRIAAVTGIAEEYIVPTLSEKYFEPGGLADKYVLISKFDGIPNDGLITGGGTDAHVFDFQFDLTLLVRLDVDVAGSDRQRLVNSTLGALPMWQKLLKAVNQWLPDDGGAPALALLAQPARTGGFSIRDRKFPTGHGWVEMRTRGQMVFRQDLT